MVVHIRKKNVRHRGTRTCGWGLCHRGKGNKGGVGNAGSGKRAKSKMPRAGLWGNQLMGKHGFKFKGEKIIQEIINIRNIEDRLATWLDQKKISHENNMYVINLQSLGFNKLLSAGKPVHKMKITVTFASGKATEKIKAAGGEIILPAQKKKSAQEKK